MTSTRQLLYCLMGFVLLGLCSCASNGPTTHMAPVRVYEMSPKDMVAVVKQAIAAEPLKLGVASDDGNAITTTWREGYQGDFHIARYWQERTQFRINVIPDWDSPQKRCRVEVTETTNERSNPRGTWRPNAGTFRPERCDEVLAQIDKQLPPGTRMAVLGAPGGVPTPAAAPPAAAAPAAPAATPTPASAAAWSNGTGSFTTSLPVAETSRRVEATVKAMQLEIRHSKLTAIDGKLTVQGATGPEIGITIQSEISGSTRVTVTQLDSTAVSPNPQLVFARLQQELAK